MPAATRGLQRYKAKSFGQTKFGPQTDLLTDLLTEWFIELHFAAKNSSWWLVVSTILEANSFKCGLKLAIHKIQVRLSIQVPLMYH